MSVYEAIRSKNCRFHAVDHYLHESIRRISTFFFSFVSRHGAAATARRRGEAGLMILGPEVAQRWETKLSLTNHCRFPRLEFNDGEKNWRPSPPRTRHHFHAENPKPHTSSSRAATAAEEESGSQG